MRRIPTLALLLACASLLPAQTDPGISRHRVLAENPLDDATGPLLSRNLPVADNATARREAMRRWFGTWSSAYHQAMHEAAALERARYARLISEGSQPGREVMAAAPGSGNWISLGPTKADVIVNGGTSLAKTDSGRPRTIIVDPTNNQVLYLCTSGGGVWKSLNGGSTWTAITDTLGTLSCGSLAMDPVDNQMLYLGLGDPFDGTGVGIVKSTDGGATWGPVTLLGDSRTIRQIVVHPGNRNVVMVTTNAGLYRSVDRGVTFSQVATAPTTYACWDVAWAGGDNFVMSVETDPANANFATAGKLLRSTDAGATWTTTTGVNAAVTRMSVVSAPSNRQRMYAMASTSADQLENVYKSLDGGLTWSTVKKTGVTDILYGQGWYNHMILVDRSNPDTVYIGGALYIAKSNSGGGSWSKVSDWLAQRRLPYVHADMHCAAQDSTGAIYVGSDGGIFKTTNGGSTWSDTLNIGITSHLIYSVGSSLVTPNAVIGGFQDNGTRVRVGTTSTFNQYIGGDGFGVVMHPKTANLMLGSLYNSRVYKSTNGTSFSSASSGITEAGSDTLAPFITRLTPGLADDTGNTVYTFANTKVYKSTNFAGSWTAMGTSGLPTDLYIRNVGAAKSNAQVVGIAGNAGRVYLTSNGGGSWVQAAALPNGAGFLSSIAFDPLDSNTVYVASVAPEAGKSHVWKTTNFGGAWTAIDGTGMPAGVPINQVAVDPGDRTVLYAATHMGLYRTADGGSTWTRWGSGLPLVSVTDVWIAPDSSKVRISTFGRGFWELQGIRPVVAETKASAGVAAK